MKPSCPHLREIGVTEHSSTLARRKGRGAGFAVYTDRPRLFARLWAIPGVQRWQVGDQEARGVFPVEALPAVAALIRTQRRRAGPRLTSEQALRLRAGARPSATSAA